MLCFSLGLFKNNGIFRVILNGIANRIFQNNNKPARCSVQVVGDLAKVQACESVACLDEWSIRTGFDCQYIVIQKYGEDQKLITSLDWGNQNKVVYSTKEVLIFSFPES